MGAALKKNKRKEGVKNALKEKGPEGPFFVPAAGRLSVWRSLGSRLTVFVDIQWLGLAFYNAFVDHYFTYLGLRGDFIHRVEQYTFENRTQSTGTGLAFQGTFGDRFQRVGPEFQVYTFHLEQLGILLGQSIFRLGD